MTRLLLYVHFDRDGLLDPHVVFQISRLAEEGFSIVFISNSPLDEESQQLLSPLVSRLVLRPNRGFDFGAWRDVILAMGRDALAQWDELVLMNSTCYGPLCSLMPIFECMMEKGYDFWGLTQHEAAEGFEAHVQSYFMVLRRAVFLSEVFFQFWHSLVDSESVMETVVKSEIGFSQALVHAGFVCGAFVEPESSPCWDYEINFRPNLSFFAAHYLLRHFEIPFVKVKAFYNYEYPSLDAPAALLQRVAATGYPSELIVKHQRRIAPVATQRRLPGTLLLLHPEDTDMAPCSLKLAVAARVSDVEQGRSLLKKLANIPCPFDCHITVPNKALYHELDISLKRKTKPVQMQKCLIAILDGEIEPSLFWLRSFTDSIFHYDTVLVMQDLSPHESCRIFSEAWQDWNSESLLLSPIAVGKILGAFQDNSHLGVVLPSYPPVFHVHKRLSYKGTATMQDSLAGVYRRLGIKPPAEIRAPLFPVGSMFWYRPAALRRLHELTFSQEDFPDEPIGDRETMAHAIERAILYVAQAAGYSYRLAISEQNLADTFFLYEDLLIKRSEDGVIVSNEELLNENRRLQEHLSLILNSRAWKLVEKLRSIKRLLPDFLRR